MSNSDQHQHVKELSVQRVNIIDAQGRTRLVLSAPDDFPDPVVNGKTMKRKGSPPAGLVFYNDEGDECGGLIFGGRSTAEGRAAGAGLMFDRFKQDQVIGLLYNEGGDVQTSGLWIWDRPATPIDEQGHEPEPVDARTAGSKKETATQGLQGTRRMFVGRNTEGEVSICLRDSQGRERIRIRIDSEDVPRFEILDDTGAVVAGLTEGGAIGSS